MVEMLAVFAILTIVGAVIMAAMFQMTRTQGTISNRTNMHAAVRSATELMQQEIGQAGRAAAPPPAITLTQAVTAGETGGSLTKTVNSTTGLFVGEYLIVGPDPTAPNCPTAPPPAGSQETIRITAIPSSTTITALFQDCHGNPSPMLPTATFASGVVPPSGNRVVRMSGSDPDPTTLTAAEASSATLLKLYGDINDDGNMVYIEYACNQGTTAEPGTFTRRVIPYNTTQPKSDFPPQVLLSNILTNPGNIPCFEYQVKTVINDTFIINVAVTLTVQTQDRDPQTGAFQTETKALLNVSPRNVYQAWQLFAGGMQDRVQPMPETVYNLLP